MDKTEILKYSLVVILLMVFLFYMIYLYKTGQREKFKKIVFKLVLVAEESFVGQGRGEEKYNWVASKLYSMFPKTIQNYFTAEEVEKLIEEAVQYMNSILK